MSNIVFDIETVGVEFDSLDGKFKEYILKYASTEEEKKEEKEKLGLWALTAQIVTIAMLYDDTGEGYVFFQPGDEKIETFQEENIKFIPCDEEKILKNFWKLILNCNKFITFNGRNFDCPFILIRSAINRVKASRNIMPHRYSTTDHVDLMDQLTFYGAVRKRFPLDLWCSIFDIESPKKNCDGSDVKTLFKEKKYLNIARYCLADVKATLQLFNYWNRYINM